jgi:hypothetical protein
MTTSNRRRSVWALCGLLCATLLLCASLLPGGTPSASAAYTATPTRDPSLFYCPNENAYVSFDWGTPMPYGGWLGSTGYYKTKAVQAYDAQLLSSGWLNWGFQAQDGSFVCRMYVSPDQNNINFVNCRPFTNWSLTSCFAIY